MAEYPVKSDPSYTQRVRCSVAGIQPRLRLSRVLLILRKIAVLCPSWFLYVVECHPASLTQNLPNTDKRRAKQNELRKGSIKGRIHWLEQMLAFPWILRLH